eukprot:scaffold189695_cov21-Prasinocladus_malaysianus.AAC.1
MPLENARSVTPSNAESQVPRYKSIHRLLPWRQAIYCLEHGPPGYRSQGYLDTDAEAEAVAVAVADTVANFTQATLLIESTRSTF